MKTFPLLLTAAALLFALLPAQLTAQTAEPISASLRALDTTEAPLLSSEPFAISHIATDGAACERKVGEDGVLLDPVFEAILNGPCSWCNSNSSCSTPCIDDNDNQSDCGDYGVCDPCREGIVELDRTIIGNQASRKFPSDCEFRTSYMVTYQSVNAGCQPFTVCETVVQTHFVPIWESCCDIVPGCFGQQCP